MAKSEQQINVNAGKMKSRIGFIGEQTFSGVAQELLQIIRCGT
jgi:hypothetical protein